MFSDGYVMDDTITSLMVMLTVVDLEPTELFAQIVNTSPATTTVGVPQIIPLLVSNVKPEGRVALMAHVDAPGRAIGGDGGHGGGDGRSLVPEMSL